MPSTREEYALTSEPVYSHGGHLMRLFSISGILLQFFYVWYHIIAKFVVSIVVVVRSYARSYLSLYRGMNQSLNISLPASKG